MRDRDDRRRFGGGRRWRGFSNFGGDAKGLLKLSDTPFQAEDSGDQLRSFSVYFAGEGPNPHHGQDGENWKSEYKGDRENDWEDGG
jgi:hypothetical protein